VNLQSLDRGRAGLRCTTSSWFFVNAFEFLWTLLHVTLLDVGMPGMNGYELVECIGGQDRLRNLPILMQPGARTSRRSTAPMRREQRLSSRAR
jgi:CheY-like chemotaxis protein